MDFTEDPQHSESCLINTMFAAFDAPPALPSTTHRILKQVVGGMRTVKQTRFLSLSLLSCVKKCSMVACILITDSRCRNRCPEHAEITYEV